VSSLYCDGRVATAKISDIKAGSVYGFRVATDSLRTLGRKKFSGAVQLNGQSAAPKAALKKTVKTGSATPITAARVESPIAPSGMKLTWHEEFNKGSKSDLENWDVSNMTTYGAGGHSTNVMLSSPENVRVQNGSLHIQSHPVRRNKSTLYQPFSSGYLTTGYVLNLSKPGRLDAWIRPNLIAGRSKGKWPGLWLRNRGKQELDITEMVGTSPATKSRSNQYQVTAHLDTTHVDNTSRSFLRSYVGTPTQFHLWTTSWDGRGNITVSCDGVVAARFTTAETPWMKRFRGAFQIRLDQFMQGNMPGPVDEHTSYGTAFEVGFLRYYS